LRPAYNRSELGKIILAACFINDLGTVLVLGLLFANYNAWLILFAAATALAMWLLPRFAALVFQAGGQPDQRTRNQVYPAGALLLGGLSALAKSEAVLPA